MPFIPNTPESSVSVDRSDSKNTNSTCRGITTSGRPCRRPVAQSPSSGRRPRTPDPRDESLYCWQHKEQASFSAHSSPGPRGTATPILGRQRTSLDTLADRLGLVDLEEKKKNKRSQKRRQDTSGSHRTSTGSSKKNSGSLLCCCFSPIEEPPRPVRPQPRPVQRPSASVPTSHRKSKQHQSNSVAPPSRSSRKSTASQTAQLKDLIPDSLDMTTASALMAELARPYVDSEEPGYIYMFWLTPTSSRSAAAPGDAARDLLAPPSSTPRSRRASDVVNSFADKNEPDAKGGKTPMVLKIGRAANVHRRMNQWQRQCGRDVEVLRYYPYSSSNSSGASTPHMTPHVKKVERLIHLELTGMGLHADLGACDTCGREHREWFQVEAKRAAVRQVDAVIRRWVEWDESNA